MNWVPWEEYQKGLPKKRMGSGALFWDKRGHFLLLKQSYRNYWTIPGGVVDENESPRQAVVREIKEELNLDVKVKQLLAVSYNSAKGDVNENLQWIFYGGVLTEKEKKKIKIDGEEIIDFRFVPVEEVDELTQRDLAIRLRMYRKALKSGMACYLEDWKLK